MIIPDVKIDEIIRIGNEYNAPKAKVRRIYSENEKSGGLCGDIEVIYNQNDLKVVKDDLVWTGSEWEFKTDRPSGIVVGSLEQYSELK